MNFLTSLLDNKKIDAILLVDLKNIRYFTNFTGSNAFAILTKEKNFFITDNRYKIQSKNEVNSKFEIIIYNRDFASKLAKLLRKNKLRSIGIEYDNIKYGFLKTLKRETGFAEFKDVSNDLLLLRSVKSEEEVNKIKIALKIAEKSFNEVKKIIKPDISEKDIAIELEYRMKRNGADDIAFPTIVASAENSALPHSKPTDKKIKNNSILLVDFGCVYNGYHSDITRSLFIGNPPKILKKCFQTVKESLSIAIENIKINSYTNKVAKLVDRYIKSKGFSEGLIHSLGHGLGLQIHELPYLSKDKKFKFFNGNVFTIEPGIYIENIGGIRIEQIGYLKDNKLNILNELDYDPFLY